jgi:hypothetical protein
MGKIAWTRGKETDPKTKGGSVEIFQGSAMFISNSWKR